MSHSRFTSLPAAAQTYVAVVVVIGAATVLQSLYRLWADSVPWDWLILALLTLVSGSATVRLPGVPATISVSETFVFTSVLLFGPAAGTLTVALDALVISGWSYRRGHPFYKVVFNVCALPLTIWAASHLFFQLATIAPLFGNNDPIDPKTLLLPLVGFTVTYFALNSWIITYAIAFEKQLRPLAVWRTHFPWLSLNYFGGASVAWLLVSYTRNVDYTFLIVILPLLVVLYLTYSLSMGRVADANRHLDQLNTLYLSTIETLAMAIDAKDQITHGHIRRVQTYALSLAKEIGVTDPPLLRAVEAAALLHDMGKLAVPEYILNKPGPLTPAEFEKMKLHASVGADILSAIDFPYPVVPIVRHHHESWDGSGYPDGLSGTAIPIGARILSVVDCFDALTSDRPYRPRLADKDAIRILLDRRGTMYDPLVVDKFLQVHSRISVPTYEYTGPFLSINEASGALQRIEPTGKPTRLEEIAASTEEMLTLFGLARSLSTTMEVSDLCDLIAKHLRRLVPWSLCVFFLYQEDTDELLAKHSTGEHADQANGLRLKMGERLSGWVAAHKQTIRNSDAALDLGEASRHLVPRLRSCMSTPLAVSGKLAGVLTLYSTSKEAFTEEHQRILEVIAGQVAPTIAASANASKLMRHSLRLAGLPSAAQVSAAIGEVQGEPLVDPTSLLYVRLDSGHAQERSGVMTQQVLADLAVLVRGALRGADILFTSDAHELVALLINTPQSIADGIATRVRAQVAASDMPLSLGGTVRVAAASTTEQTRSLAGLLDIARRAAAATQADLPHRYPPRNSVH